MYKDLLLSKNGYMAMILAKELVCYKVGDKLPTITELCKKYESSRGTIENAIKFLQANEAVKLESKGWMGTILIEKNMKILLSFAGITSLIGVMPLPYSKRYEGLASGLIASMENQYNLSVSMAYMRGSMSRIAMLTSKYYDYAIVSRYAAQKIINKYNNIEIVKSFGTYSYLSQHVIVFSDNNCNEITDGMKIGVDTDSVDQKLLTEEVCEGKNVQYVYIKYSQAMKFISRKEIDAVIWNKDEIIDKMLPVHYVDYDHVHKEFNEAVLVVSKEDKEKSKIIDEIIDEEVVVRIQKAVMDEVIVPSY